jgi:hypothetical protein
VRPTDVQQVTATKEREAVGGEEMREMGGEAKNTTSEPAP